MILGYFELPEDEQPEDTIWNHPEKLEAWFKNIKEAREEKYGSKSKNEEWEDVDLDDNEYAKEVKKKYGIK